MVRKNKKAALFEFNLLWFLAIFLMVFLFAGVIYLVNYTLDLQKDTTRLRANIFLLRAIYSQDGLSYTDEVTLRMYPGTIDYARFNKDTLEKSIFYEENRMIAANVSLFDKDNKLMAHFIYNQKMFDTWMPAVAFKEYRKITLRRPVMINKAGDIIEGTIKFDLVTPYG